MQAELLLPHEPVVHAHSALLLYRSQARRDDGATTTTTIAMHHPVRTRAGQLYLGEGAAVTEGLLRTLLDLFQREDLSYLPAHVLALSSRALVWFEPARARTLLFREHQDPALHPLDGQSFPQPALLFRADAGGLRVHALGNDERPTPETPLFHAPYSNLFGDGRVCTGSVDYPAGRAPDDAGAWSRAFFLSDFTHLGAGTGARWAYPGTQAELWRASAERGAFDPAWLRPAGRNLGTSL